MSKANNILVMLTMAMALMAFAPTASADHNASHECTEQDPCDDDDTGCDTLVTVGGCTYDYHSSCYYGAGSDGTQGTYCYHGTHQCMVNIAEHCYWHGSTAFRLFR